MAKRRTAGDPKTAVAYLRVSTREQALGPEAQRKAIEEWAAREGIHVALYCVDQGKSGAAPILKRQGLQDALKAVRELGAGLLLVARRDRVGRDRTIAPMVERELATYGARLRSIAGEGTESTDHDDPDAGLVSGMHDLLAEHYRKLIKHRTRAALAVKKARNERMGKVPIGFRVASDGVHLETDPAEQAILDRMLSLRASGLTQRGIVAVLAAESTYNPRTQRPFTQPIVGMLLNRETLAA